MCPRPRKRIVGSCPALDIITTTHTGPDERVYLATLGARLPHKMGGANIATYVSTSTTAHVASVAATWPRVASIFPPLANLSPATSDNTVAKAFRAGYMRIDSTLSHVRARFASIEGHIYHDVNGAQHQAYHPRLPKPSLAKPLPPLSELWRDTDSEDDAFDRRSCPWSPTAQAG